MTDIDKDILEAISKCEKAFGKGSVIYNENPIKVERQSTGVLDLDIITGGGYPKGRIVEVYAPESVGKTTLTIHGMVEAQKSGGRVGFIDTEHSFDIDYAMSLGLRLENDKGERIFFISQPNSAEEALQIAENLIATGKFAMVVVDSVAALVPKAETEGEMGEQKMGLQARLMSQAMRKLTGIVHKTNTILYFTNQLRSKIGVVYGSPEVTSGGNALKFFASLRLDMRKVSSEKEGEDFVSNTVRIKTVKNKTFPPFKTCEATLVYGKGFDRMESIINIGTDLGFIKKSGSWYAYEDTKLGQGKGKVKELLTDNPELMEILETKIKEHYGL